MAKGHYQRLIQEKGRTKFASCGYVDRFDPFILNNNPSLRELYCNLLSSHLGNIPCEKLLDIGCGTGIYFDALSRHSCHIDAIDFSREMIQVAQDYCQKKGLKNIYAKIGSAERIESESGIYDVAIGFDVLHHIGDLDKALNEIHRVLKPGGRFLVFEPNICNPLMFLVHALPPEERLAIGRNRPKKLIALLEKRFQTIHWEGVCAIITQANGARRFIIDTYLELCKISGLKQYYPRQVWLGIKTTSSKNGI